MQSISVDQIRKTTATCHVTTNVESAVFWAIAAAGTRYPGYDELQDMLAGEANPKFFAYGTTYTYTQHNMKTDVEITGLRADREYTFYSWLDNMQGKPSETISQFSFETDSVYQAASFTLSFDQVYINDDDLNEIQSAL